MTAVPAGGQAPPAEVASTLPVAAVTVYRDRARVVRRGRVRVPAGRADVVVSGLPSQLVADSVRAAASGPAGLTLLGATVATRVLPWGPPGTGKTTIARVIASTTDREFVALSAVTAGVKDVREVIEAARRRLAETGRGTILFLDEVHRFNKSQQDALLPAVETGVLTLVGATTENPFFEVNAPLISRSTIFRLEPLPPGDLRVLVDRGLGLEGATADEDAVEHLVDLAGGDGRAALTTLEVALGLADADGGRTRITLTDVERARQARVIRYGEDEHYDVISAFIKSLRGSDPDAGLYWLARMLEAGEDARFIARRMVILASEDVGMADSNALVVADAAARAVEFVGLPEAALNLAHCVVYLATAPKSNRAMLGLARAGQDVRDRAAGAVPPPLRSQHPYQRNKLREGGGYVYPHDEPGAFVRQQYRPGELEGRVYYVPTEHGDEARVGRRLRELWGDDVYEAVEPPRGKPGLSSGENR